MSDEKEVSNARAAWVAGLALVLGALYVIIGVDWYYKGHLVLCNCELSVDRNSWCYRPEAADTTAPPLNYTARPNIGRDPQAAVNDILSQSLGAVDRCYKGTTASQEYKSSYSHRLGLWWNSIFLTDDARREALGAIVTAIYVAYLGFAAAVLKDWWLQAK